MVRVVVAAFVEEALVVAVVVVVGAVGFLIVKDSGMIVRLSAKSSFPRDGFASPGRGGFLFASSRRYSSLLSLHEHNFQTRFELDC